MSQGSAIAMQFFYQRRVFGVGRGGQITLNPSVSKKRRPRNILSHLLLDKKAFPRPGIDFRRPLESGLCCVPWHTVHSKKKLTNDKRSSECNLLLLWLEECNLYYTFHIQLGKRGTPSHDGAVNKDDYSVTPLIY